MDGRTLAGGNIIPFHYRLAGYKNANILNNMSPVARKKVELRRKLPGPLHGNISSPLAEVSLCPAAYVSEQHRFLQDCAYAQARLNLSCSHML